MSNDQTLSLAGSKPSKINLKTDKDFTQFRIQPNRLILFSQELQLYFGGGKLEGAIEFFVEQAKQ